MPYSGFLCLLKFDIMNAMSKFSVPVGKVNEIEV